MRYAYAWPARDNFVTTLYIALYSDKVLVYMRAGYLDSPRGDNNSFFAQATLGYVLAQATLGMLTKQS